VALFELLTVTPELRQGIADRLPTPQLQELAIEAGMEPLRAMAVTAAQEGRISLQDLIGAV
jgi:type II secretory ATPase GspE/PulE/Tfp pilus assembly ATPase PilB-like protein